MLKLENLSVTLSKDSNLEYQVLKDLNLSVASGEFIIVIGGNGAGKSTMLNAISGYIKSDSGRIVIDNQDITNISQKNRSKIVAKVMQDPRVGTIENMTILENMAFAYKRGATRNLLPFSNIKVKKLFKDRLSLLGIGLENRLDTLVSSLSGGQRQALSLLMAVLTDFKILLLDEITAALDPKSAVNIMEIVNKIVREENKVCVVITHNMSQALKYGDRTLLLCAGKFIKEFSQKEKSVLTPYSLSAEFEEF